MHEKPDIEPTVGLVFCTQCNAVHETPACPREQ